MRSTATRKPKAKSIEVKVGAVHALKRLETEESVQYSRLKQAEGGKDAFEIKLARDAWLKTSEGLRRFDILIEAARRETGELIPRKDVEVALSNLAGWLHFSLRDAVGGPDKAYEHMWRALRGYVGSPSSGKSAAHSAAVPVWVVRALQAEGIWSRPEEQLLSWRRSYHVDAAARLFPNDAKKFASHVETAMAKDGLALKGTL